MLIYANYAKCMRRLADFNCTDTCVLQLVLGTEKGSLTQNFF